MSQKTPFYLSSLLRSYVSVCQIPQVKQTHAQIIVHGFLFNLTLQTDLLLAYSRCGSLPHARQMFDKMPGRSMYSWNILIFSYVQHSMFSVALDVFEKFRQMGLRPDHYTLPPMFKACAGIGDEFLGRSLYGLVIKLGLEGYVVVSSSFLDYCIKCGCITDAKRVFSYMSCKDSVAWSLMISGFGRAGLYRDSLNCFREMLVAGVKIDAMTIPSVLNACGGDGDLIKGKEIHGQAIKNRLYDTDIAIGNSLIDMYSKCGCLDDAERVFRSMNNINLVTWTTMISCYGLHGKGEDSLLLFEKMIGCGFTPNPVTLTAILASCSHSGMIDEGRRIFSSIRLVYGFEPSVEHYACLVDLLGRFGYLDEALGLVRNMQTMAPASVWGALLAGCVMHKNVDIGETAAHHLFKLEPRNSSNYIALCSIYDSLSLCDGVAAVRAKMKDLGLVKTPGCSWITIYGIVNKFYQGDHSHPSTLLIYDTLDRMVKVASLASEL